MGITVLCARRATIILCLLVAAAVAGITYHILWVSGHRLLDFAGKSHIAAGVFTALLAALNPKAGAASFAVFTTYEFAQWPLGDSPFPEMSQFISGVVAATPYAAVIAAVNFAARIVYRKLVRVMKNGRRRLSN